VATLLDSDSRLAPAMLAIFKLGRLYVPIDPRCPVARGAFMVDDVAAPIVVTDKRYEERARQMAGAQRVVGHGSGSGSTTRDQETAFLC
jgi:acyl-CoA synthetase (AMP-forming)/AMP-acid ligase II